MAISILEDTGYMARAAFIMDRLMHRIGLHGKSFNSHADRVRVFGAGHSGHPGARKPPRPIDDDDGYSVDQFAGRGFRFMP